MSRSAIMTFANTLLAVVAALIVYHLVIERDGREKMLARMDADSAATRHELERVEKEQAGIRETLTRSPVAATGADEKALLMRADFSAAAGSMKTAIAEYYATNAKLPSSNAEIGLPAPAEYRGKSLKSATVSAGGAIEFVFDAASGVDGGRIHLIPDLARVNAMGMQWRCETADFALIKRALADCEYVPAGQALTAPEAGR